MRALAALLLLPLPALGQDRPDPMVLIEPTPRLPCSGTEPACKINRALLALDQKALALPCAPPDDATIAGMGLNPGRDPLQLYYAHFVDVAFHGKTFFSLRLQDFGDCPGGAHGWADSSSVTFDLTSGERIDPSSLLPASLGADGLGQLYLARRAKDLPQECRADLARVTRFDLAITPEGLVVTPLGLPYAARACGDSVTLPPDLLQTLGADPRLTADLRP